MPASEATIEKVREYYGKVLKNSGDLKTSACCCGDDVPALYREILKEIDPEITERFYGCGSPIPSALEGCTVLDLGCGTGRDTFLCSKLVGPGGRVIGLDMTEEQLTVGRRHLAAQTQRFGFDLPNVEFRQGYIEDLRGAGLGDASVDVVISNCVINLSPDKPRVFREILRVLKPGGEMFIADVFADRRLPAALAEDQTLLGECLAGAMYVEDFRRLMHDLGCADVRYLAARTIEMDTQDIALASKLGEARFCSLTFRAFKLEGIEDRSEDYGQTAEYLGGIVEAPEYFVLDAYHVFPRGAEVRVCGNTAAMLSGSRLGRHFRVTGDHEAHYGLFQVQEEHGGGCCDHGGECCC